MKKIFLIIVMIFANFAYAAEANTTSSDATTTSAKSGSILDKLIDNPRWKQNLIVYGYFNFKNPDSAYKGNKGSGGILFRYNWNAYKGWFKGRLEFPIAIPTDDTQFNGYTNSGKHVDNATVTWLKTRIGSKIPLRGKGKSLDNLNYFFEAQTFFYHATPDAAQKEVYRVFINTNLFLNGFIIQPQLWLHSTGERHNLNNGGAHPNTNILEARLLFKSHIQKLAFAFGPKYNANLNRKRHTYWDAGKEYYDDSILTDTGFGLWWTFFYKMSKRMYFTGEFNWLKEDTKSQVGFQIRF